MRNTNGFSLIEAITAIAIFVIIISGVLGLFSLITRSSKVAREQVILTALSAARLEVMRNLPYSGIGTVNGNPNGTLPDFTNPEQITHESVNYHIYYEVTYLDDSADGTILAGTDVAPNDYKQVKLYIKNLSSNNITSFVTNVSPKGLEGITNSGALMLKVFDANGQPVPNASLNIKNTSVIPNINLNRTTDAAGDWIEVGLPASINGYQITATKTGFSTDSTYPITVSNPNPVKPHATINNGAVTQLTFAIDTVSNLSIQTLDATCGPIAGVHVRVLGSKLIGTAPDVLKYDKALTSWGGVISMDGIEWDVYLPSLISSGYTLYGTSPIQQVNVLPGATQKFVLILGPDVANSLLVIVKSASTNAPIEGASVRLSRTGPSEEYTKITGGSVWNQSGWSGGSGQADFVIPSQYFSDDGNVDNNGASIELAQVGSTYVPTGQLTSSSFNTGGLSNYTTIEWEPTSQNPSSSLMFQVATNNDNATWNFIGPDGTPSTFYTVSGSSLHASHANSQYIRYKAFLTTSDTNFTPSLSNLNINYVSGCNTPGQVVFPDISAGNNYTLEVTMPGYSTYTLNNLNISGKQTLEVLMTP